MQLSIKKMTPEDLPSVLEMLAEFAAFLDLGAYLEVTEKRLSAALFDEGSFASGLMAFDGVAPIAYAIYFPAFTSFRGQRGLFLEDIYIKPAYRSHGIGEKMLRELARDARDRGFERIDFQVLEDNTGAVKFYERLGAIKDEKERHFKFIDKAFEKLADSA